MDANPRPQALLIHRPPFLEISACGAVPLISVLVVEHCWLNFGTRANAHIPAWVLVFYQPLLLLSESVQGGGPAHVQGGGAVASVSSFSLRETGPSPHLGLVFRRPSARCQALCGCSAHCLSSGPHQMFHPLFTPQLLTLQIIPCAGTTLSLTPDSLISLTFTPM